jgi:hypothetical protein
VRFPLQRPVAAVLLVPAAAGAVALSSCGGGGNSADAEKQLNQAFKTKVDSADLKIAAEVKVNGSSALSKPIRIEASGPFRQNKGKLPSLDIGLNISPGGGQTVQTGFLSTGDRSFVKFQDVYYEQPQSQVEQANRQIAANQGNRSSLKSLGLDPRSWLKDAKEEGDEEVAGTSTKHVSGKLDVQNLLRDVNDFIERSGKTLGATTGRLPQQLSQSDIDKVSEIVKDPNFDVYVAKSDHTIRRIAARVELEVPEKDRAAVGGLKGGTLDFSVELSKVNGNQRVVAPARARPLSDLTNTLGAGALGGLGGGSGISPSTPPSTSGGGTTTTPKSDAFKKYADCLDKAKSQDTQALQRCAKLLK